MRRDDGGDEVTRRLAPCGPRLVLWLKYATIWHGRRKGGGWMPVAVVQTTTCASTPAQEMIDEWLEHSYVATHWLGKRESIAQYVRVLPVGRTPRGALAKWKGWRP